MFPKYPEFAAPSAHSHETPPVAQRNHQQKQSLEEISHPFFLLFFIS